MFYVYFLKSSKNSDIYIGSTASVMKRLRSHNLGKVRSTRPYRPWTLLTYEEYKTRSEAVKRERFLKTGQQRELLKGKFWYIL